jgi:hypothetical protein
MHRFLRGLGLTLLLLGAAAAVAEVLTLVASGGASRVSLGSIWYALSANSLVGFQAAVERNLGELAGNVLIALLALPAWLVLGLLGLAARLLGRRERRGFG